MADAATERVAVYALAHPAVLSDEQDVVVRLLRQELGAADASRHQIHISASSGCIGYVDQQDLWNRPWPAILPAATEARGRAEDFLRRWIATLSPANRQLPPSLLEVEAVPTQLRPVQLAMVPRGDGKGWDHWLYRMQPALVATRPGRRVADIFGALVEVRVGEYGRIVGFNSRWRPLAHERIFVDLKPPVVEADQTKTANQPSGGRQESEPILVYVLDGDGVPQFYLAPYYMKNHGHDIEIEGASAYSLSVQISREQREGEMILTAHVDGGSGDYAFNWALYPLDEFAEGLRILGSGAVSAEPSSRKIIKTSTVRVANGVYVVLVNVKDRTGAFKHHQQQVFASPFPDAVSQAPLVS